jgi:hypothetical protein
LHDHVLLERVRAGIEKTVQKFLEIKAA